jgi:hypothetical protein
MRELTHFETEYAKYKANREAIQNPEPADNKGKTVKKTVVKKVSKK